MALFSDIDWLIIVAVAAFVLLGNGNADALRTLGRLYARAGRIKQELLGEFMKAADLPQPAPGQSLSIRGALLGTDPVPTQSNGIPAAVTTPPVGPTPPPFVPTNPWTTSPWTGSYPVPTWSMTMPAVPDDPRGPR
jgi:hypothetical protein